MSTTVQWSRDDLDTPILFLGSPKTFRELVEVCEALPSEGTIDKAWAETDGERHIARTISAGMPFDGDREFAEANLVPAIWSALLANLGTPLGKRRLWWRMKPRLIIADQNDDPDPDPLCAPRGPVIGISLRVALSPEPDRWFGVTAEGETVPLVSNGLQRVA